MKEVMEVQCSKRKPYIILSNTVYIVRILLCSNAHRLLECKVGLGKRSHTSCRVPLEPGLKSCSNIHLILELGCDKGPCPTARMALGGSEGSAELC